MITVFCGPIHTWEPCHGNRTWVPRWCVAAGLLKLRRVIPQLLQEGVVLGRDVIPQRAQGLTWPRFNLWQNMFIETSWFSGWCLEPSDGEMPPLHESWHRVEGRMTNRRGDLGGDVRWHPKLVSGHKVILQLHLRVVARLVVNKRPHDLERAFRRPLTLRTWGKTWFDVCG